MLLEYLCCPGAIQVLNHSVASKESRAKQLNKRQGWGRRAPDTTAQAPHVPPVLAEVFRSSISMGQKMKLTLGG